MQVTNKNPNIIFLGIFFVLFMYTIPASWYSSQVQQSEQISTLLCIRYFWDGTWAVCLFLMCGCQVSSVTVWGITWVPEFFILGNQEGFMVQWVDSKPSSLFTVRKDAYTISITTIWHTWLLVLNDSATPSGFWSILEAAVLIKSQNRWKMKKKKLGIFTTSCFPCSCAKQLY